MSKFYAPQIPDMTKREIEHLELAREIAGECIVLLENDGALPFQTRGNVALFGNGAGNTIKGGTGSGDVNTRTNIDIIEGMEEAGYTVTTKKWIERQTQKREESKKTYSDWIRQESEKQGVNELLICFSNPFMEVAPFEITEEDIEASRTDTAIYIIARNSGEGLDRCCKRGDYFLFEEEKEQLEKLGKAYKKLVLVLNIGGVIDMTEIKSIDGINAVVLMTQLGNVGGLALADILTGAAVPSGKLTDTWAKDYKDYPSSEEFSHNDGNVDDEYYKEGIYVGYRYFDTFEVEPVYCFGYGKSYGDFEIKTENVSIGDMKVRVTVNVKNNSKDYSGREVVQVYYSAPKGNLHKPYQELAAFAKTSLLAPGASENLELSFGAGDMASYCEECASWVLESGEYILRVGNSSRSTEAAAIVELDQRVKIEQLQNLFSDSEKVEEITPPDIKRNDIDADICKIHISTENIVTRTVMYQGKKEELTTDYTKKLTITDVKSGSGTLEDLTAQLTVQELAELCVGTLRSESGNIVGNASYVVPGAAGDTSSVVRESRGIRNMILADGPAGLRLQPIFKATKEGEVLTGGSVMGDLSVPFDTNMHEDETDTYFQYCTAIPIGWALAQSWNTALLEKAGDMVGIEMESFGVDLWLAPALNIHRNPLCGRNFEYFSEDPLISGKMAAAITCGVQRHARQGTTVKHFAANNQEDNRYFTNSHVSERALREIYLKGFEIVVKESQPMAIMTSYNLLNGIHTANSYDLIQSVLRDEWRFDGVVMTDWYTSQSAPGLMGESTEKYPISSSVGCIYAGNDLQMPGCRKNVDDIVEAIKEDKEIDGWKITLADLQFCAANVIRVAERVTVEK